MPNFVYGNLYVTGDKKALLKFKEYAETEEEYYDDMDNFKLKKTKTILDMSKFIPYPKKFKEIDKTNKEFYDEYKKVKEKVEKSEKLTKEERKMADELTLIELGDGHLPYRKDGYNSGGYQWCCENWGTKWNFCDTGLQEDDEQQLHYSFKTAWSVPMPVLFKMSKMYPELTFEYLGDEESEAFEVEYEFKNGKMISKDEKEWHEIQIEKIQEGNIDGFDYNDELYKEVEKHKGHEIIHISDDKLKEFRCKTCDNKVIWDCNKQ